MHLAKVIGTIWATRKVETLEGAKMQIVQPLTPALQPLGDPIVAVDTIGAGQGEVVYYVTAREATIPYPRDLAPIDASIVGIVDRVDHFMSSERTK
ncbi:MAG: EutN/CcmL family microcompartment protein [candidate division KSB1 bacterium]|nr:EutN/CcmL family microcompartment protein [candidate division KSB1 bacterium]MDQ7064898.1 EutN/CcmL family microcompartment protein [candidate division KSB1 bacterium]